MNKDGRSSLNRQRISNGMVSLIWYVKKLQVAKPFHWTRFFRLSHEIECNKNISSKKLDELPFSVREQADKACGTGQGKLTGDGVVGLSRSLISAGTPSVIVSLWKIPDDATSALMTDFYENLQQKDDKAVALRKAMLKVMKEYPNQVNWGAFTLVGEAR
jgi:CHAT domain